MNQGESEVERDFLTSWDDVDEIFGWPELPVRFRSLVLGFITQLRAAGYDRKLRADQSLFMLVVSRSRQHGLRPEQPSIAFAFEEDSMHVLQKQAVLLSKVPVCLSPDVEAVLEELLQHPID